MLVDLQMNPFPFQRLCSLFDFDRCDQLTEPWENRHISRKYHNRKHAKPNPAGIVRSRSNGSTDQETARIGDVDRSKPSRSSQPFSIFWQNHNVALEPLLRSFPRWRRRQKRPSQSQYPAGCVGDLVPMAGYWSAYSC
ncbi:hypothetical protein SAMN05444392_103168 [Seinonella peptonophila]|uniref:Uncharacterized protein n=1 Tax=Seinonella peptonophila TaxID=112248 RepID=A0A1M4WDH2_9BACL|nr:hypothetical protein SAMN05444392_103168 [Seinonella peptonophila]